MMQNVFTKTLERITKETGLVGGVAIVFKNGEITFAAPYGYEDRENNIPMTLLQGMDGDAGGAGRGRRAYRLGRTRSARHEGF